MESTFPFRGGDVVRHKTGGPNMAVRRICHNKHNELVVCCSWFAGERHKSGSFEPCVLDLVPVPTLYRP